MPTKQGLLLELGRVTVPLSMLKSSSGAITRGTIIGFLAGALPGAGASIGSFIAYTVEKRVSNKNDTFGKGDPRGVAAPEAANNAAAGGALVPMLALGVPGPGTTAVLLAMLLALNITPGPLLFSQHPDVVWGQLTDCSHLRNTLVLVQIVRRRRHCGAPFSNQLKSIELELLVELATVHQNSAGPKTPYVGAPEAAGAKILIYRWECMFGREP